MRRALRVALGVLAAAALAVAWASVDRCGEWRSGPGGLLSVARGTGALRLGASRVEVALPFPVVVGGYGPGRSEASSASVPIAARATVLEVGGQRFGLVALDVLLVGDALVAQVREGFDFPVWVVATHTHSGPGGHDERLLAQLAALGSWRPEVTEALVSSARKALGEAAKGLAPAMMRVDGSSLAETRARSGDEVDHSLTRVSFVSSAGQSVAQWLLLAAHPTLVPRHGAQLDPDYPGRVAAALEADGGVTLVLQHAGGNASAAAAMEPFVDDVVRQVHAAGGGPPPVGTVDFGYSAFDVQLPHPDGSRLIWAPLRPATENLLCARASKVAEVAVLRVGPLRLVSIPAEVSTASAKQLSVALPGAQVVSLANGYQGYVEPDEVVRQSAGESRKQYFPPDLLRLFVEGARLASDGAGFSAGSGAR